MDWFEMAAFESVFPGVLTGVVVVVCSACGETVEISAEDYEAGIILCGSCRDN
jgi:formylmethanofuran dehydrogenase subunit E